jgi:hypothetical protein
MRQESNPKMYDGIFLSVCRQNPMLAHEKAHEITRAIVGRKIEQKHAREAQRPKLKPRNENGLIDHTHTGNWIFSSTPQLARQSKPIRNLTTS